MHKGENGTVKQEGDWRDTEHDGQFKRSNIQDEYLA